MIEIPEVHTEQERKEILFPFLLANKKALIIEKKANAKTCDGFSFLAGKQLAKGAAVKAVDTSKGILDVTAIINTTNWLDSHKDVHLPGLWAKSVAENKMWLHIQEHDMSFAKIIADGEDLKVFTKKYSWQDLGYAYPGSTEALVFNSQVKQSRNTFMFDQYAAGYVKNHSVYMQYVQLVLAVNEPDSTAYGAEYEAWQKYYSEIVNKEAADDSGYFWAVKEAKGIEGSAVPRGSNIVTPTLSVTGKGEPSQDTPGNGPSDDTPNIFKLNLSVPDTGFKVGKRF